MRTERFCFLRMYNWLQPEIQARRAEAAGFRVEKFLSGPLGGDAQIASRIAEGLIQMIIFFRDPLDKHPHEPDIFMLMRLCDVHNIPIPTNPATAGLFMKAI